MKTNSKSEWVVSLENSAEKIGGEILLIENVMVDYTRPYSEIILNARKREGKQMDPSEHQALEIANKCEPSKHEAIKETVVLFRYSDWMRMELNAGYKKAIEWGLSNNLCKTTLHVPLAVIEQNPYLFSGICMSYVVATANCNNRSYFASYRRYFRSDVGAGTYCQFQSGLKEAWFSFIIK